MPLLLHAPGPLPGQQKGPPNPELHAHRMPLHDPGSGGRLQSAFSAEQPQSVFRVQLVKLPAGARIANSTTIVLPTAIALSTLQICSFFVGVIRASSSAHLRFWRSRGTACHFSYALLLCQGSILVQHLSGVGNSGVTAMRRACSQWLLRAELAAGVRPAYEKERPLPARQPSGVGRADRCHPCRAATPRG